MSGPDRAVELVGLSWSDLDKPVGLVVRAQLVYVRIYLAVTRSVTMQLPNGYQERLRTEKETAAGSYGIVWARGSGYGRLRPRSNRPNSFKFLFADWIGYWAWTIRAMDGYGCLLLDGAMGRMAGRSIDWIEGYRAECVLTDLGGISDWF
ncbi:hypothetical protein Bca52824_017651 [Brassica carinata]|uniref:Uncharacterized protein n=1 Tax=Brassica carinata TaxID=52824 RepID=A0A8X8AVL5_BRACI|nr:hypothetical protein Bca52824_017651 [Brassica carinata]